MSQVAEHSTRSKHFRFSMRSLLLFFVVVSVLLSFKKPVTIAYHLWSLDRTGEQLKNSTSKPQTSSLMAARFSHVHALTRLGHFEKKVFYIGSETPKTLELQIELFDFQNAKPQRGIVSYSFTKEMSEATVYSSASDMPLWSSIMASHNVRADKLLLPVNSL